MTVNIGMHPLGGTGVPKWLRALLFAAALLETLGGLTGLTLLTDFHEYESSPAQWSIFASLAIAPFFAIPALWFVVKGKIRYAILALAAVTISTLLLDKLPTFTVQGAATLGTGLTAVYSSVIVFVLPALCLWGAWLAWKNQRLTLAGVLVALPSLATIADLLAFALGVATY